MSEYTIGLDERCKTCDRRIAIFAEFVPNGAGVRHAACPAVCDTCRTELRFAEEHVEAGDGRWLCGTCDSAENGEDE